MKLMHSKSRGWASCVASCLVIATVIVLPLTGLAQSAPRNEFPGRRVGGGTRGACALNTEGFRALVPESNLIATNRDRPALYFVIPTLEQDYAANFMVRDAAGALVHQENLTIDQSTEILKVQVPSETLTSGADYQWLLMGICNPQNRFQNVLLSGTLHVQAESAVSPTLTEAAIAVQLAQAEQAYVSGQTGDAISTLAELRLTYPEHEDVAAAWQSLLQNLYADEAITGSL